MKLLNSFVLAIIAFLFLTSDADGQKKQTVTLNARDDVALK